MQYRRYSTRMAAQTLARAARSVQQEVTVKDNICAQDAKTSYSFDDMLAFAKIYASLGDAMTEQLDDILSANPERMADVNPNAIWEIRRAFNKGTFVEVDHAIADYKDGIAGCDAEDAP